MIVAFLVVGLLLCMLFAALLSMVVMSIVDNRRQIQNKPPRKPSNVKRYLILAAAIVTLVTSVVSLFVALIYIIINLSFVGETGLFNIPIVLICFALFVVKLAASICLFRCIRGKGQYLEKSYYSYILGIIFVALSAGFVSWLLLLISIFFPEPKQPEVTIENNVEQLQNNT